MIRKLFLIAVCFFLTMQAGGALANPPLDISYFVGTYRVLGCDQHQNGTLVPGTDICRPADFPRVALASAAGGYELRFLDANGGVNALPVMTTYRIETPELIDEAGFASQESAASWSRRQYLRASGALLLQSFAVFSLVNGNQPLLTLSDFNGSSNPTQHLRRRLTLRRQN